MEHAHYWVEAGHEVSVVTCAPNFPRGRIFQGYRNRLYQEEWIEGVRVIRLWSYMAANQGFARRTIDHASFLFSAVSLSFRFPPFDVILASSPPLFVALAGYWISALSGKPWVFEIRDLWPATVQAVGLGRRAPIKHLERMELSLYRKADRIIALTNAFKENLSSRNIPPAKIDVVTNGVDSNVFRRGRVKDDARTEMGVSGNSFLAGYIGTIGMTHGLETVVEAAYLCRDVPEIRILIMGEGSERPRLHRLVNDYGIHNVIFKDFVSHEKIPAYLAALDLFIVHLKSDPLFKTVIPSKIFESMAMETPMVYAVEGESARIVADAGAGVCVPSGDPQAMAEAIRYLRENPDKRVAMGRQGRDFVTNKYSREVKAKAALRCLEEVVRTRVACKS